MGDTNRSLLAQYWHGARGYWKATGARCLTVALAGGVALQLALQYRLNYWSRDFFDAFGRRDAAALRNEALLFLLLAGLSILAAIFSIWARMTMQRKWRAWLTRTLLDRWLAKDRINQLQFDQGEDRNPEFRIAEDARVATQAPVDLAASFLTAFLSAVIFISVLWNVGGDLTVQIDGHALTVPKYLVITVAIYSAVLTLGMMTIGRRMVSVIAGKNASEAQFRSVASHVRERGASALAGDRPAEHKRVSGSFDSLIVHWRDLCHQVMRTTLVSTGNILVAPVIGWVLCAPKYLEGTMSLGEVAQAVAAFVMVQSALNWLVDNYPGLAECMSSVNRVAALLQALDKTEEEHDVPVLDRGQYDTRQPNPEPVKQPALAGR